ncbi:MAG: hypothetical protein LUD15_04630 [Bacteroides sp.]|nr:hypothetical protein [Bacteroides sp.]
MKRSETSDKSVKPRETQKTLGRLISYLAGDRPLLVVIFVMILISISADLAGSYMLRPIINDYIIPGDIPGLVSILTILGVIYLGGVVAVFIRSILLNRIA